MGKKPMDQAKKGPLDGSPPQFEDIPEARREAVEGVSETASKQRWPWVGGGLAAVALLLGALLLVPAVRSLLGIGRFQPMSGIANRPAVAPPITDPSSNPSTANDPAAAPSAAPASAADRLVPTQKTLLGHRAYNEAPTNDLVALTADGRIQLRRAAADKFQDMAAAAAREGVYLVPLSGFRSQQDQARIFFQVKAERGETSTTRAEVSAPPGYSEHHTGYALDIGDGDRPETDVEPEFAQTKAFRWLEQNAAYYDFELSFPENNAQGVAYEPWHWRFVGDRASLETFYQEGETRPSP